MLPGGFKKDSRVWLFKNAHLYKKQTMTTDRYKTQLGDDAYENVNEDPFVNPSPYITDERGHVFKKDSRTWLHKSSCKKRSNSIGDYKLPATPGKPSSKRRQLRGQTHTNDGDLGTTLLGSSSSTKMFHEQNVQFKLKKSNESGAITKEGNFAHLLVDVKETSISDPIRKPGTSFHNLSTLKSEGNCELSTIASDFCIVSKRKLPLPHSLSSSSSNNDNSDDIGQRSDTPSHFENGSQASVSHPDVADIAVGYRDSNMEISRDGLRELEKIMKEQKRNRMDRVTLRHTDDSQVSRLHDVSPETASSGSKVSLDACLNLSEELGTENVPVQSPADLLCQTLECLQIYPNKGMPLPDETHLSGDS